MRISEKTGIAQVLGSCGEDDDKTAWYDFCLCLFKNRFLAMNKKKSAKVSMLAFSARRRLAKRRLEIISEHNAAKNLCLSRKKVVDSITRRSVCHASNTPTSAPTKTSPRRALRWRALLARTCTSVWSRGLYHTCGVVHCRLPRVSYSTVTARANLYSCATRDMHSSCA